MLSRSARLLVGATRATDVCFSPLPRMSSSSSGAHTRNVVVSCRFSHTRTAQRRVLANIANLGNRIITSKFGTSTAQVQQQQQQQYQQQQQQQATATNRATQERIYDEEFVLRPKRLRESYNINYTTSISASVPLPKIEGRRTLSAIEINAKGIITERILVKNELLSEMKIQARDLRNIDVAYPPHMASILVREKTIIVHIANIRAVIQWDRLLLFNNEYDDSLRNIIATSMREFIITQNSAAMDDASSLPFEFRALEAILIYAYDFFDKQVSSLQPLIDAEIRALQTNPEHQLENLDLYHYKKQLTRCEVAAQEVRGAIEDILKNDEDMAAMYLSTKAHTGYPRRKNQHDEIEILLENYLRQIEQVQGLIKELRESIAVTEDYVNLQLDSVRNRMMRHNLVLTVGTMSTAIGGLITGAFGMNLYTGMENNPHAFLFVSGMVVAMATGVFFALRSVFGIRYLTHHHHHHVFRASSRRSQFYYPVSDPCISHPPPPSTPPPHPQEFPSTSSSPQPPRRSKAQTEVL